MVDIYIRSIPYKRGNLRVRFQQEASESRWWLAMTVVMVPEPSHSRTELRHCREHWSLARPWYLLHGR